MTPLHSRRALTRALSGAALSVLTSLVLVAPAAASSDPTPKPGRIVADSGFRPATNGYGFPNYGSEAGVVDMNAGSMRRLFGTRVCSQIDGTRCTLTPAAEEWMNDQNEGMAGGHCFGMATTSQFFFQGFGNPDRPDPFGSPFTPRLDFDANAKLQRHIATAWATQSLPNVRKTFAGGKPSVVIKLLRRSLERGRMPYELLIYDNSDGHAISPYAVNKLGRNQWQILVYDNNWPGRKRAVNVNTKNETWRYQLAPGTVWGGDAKTGTLVVGNPRSALGKNPCPFCKDDAQADDDPGNDDSSGRVELRLAGSGPREELAEMRVSDGEGEAGVGPGGVYDRLDGADVYTPATGVEMAPFDGSDAVASPQLQLDSTRAYSVELSQPDTFGSALGAQGLPVDGSSPQETLSMTGAGYSLSAETQVLPGELDTVGFDPGTRTIEYTADASGAEDLSLGLTTNADEADYEIDFAVEDMPAGASLSISADPSERRLDVVLGAADSLDVELVVSTQGPDGEDTETRSIELEGGSQPNAIDY